MKKVLVFLLVVLAIIQFIRPQKNKAAGPFPYDISQRYPMPDNIHAILEKTCFDCHSNNTTYPWYDQVQPVMWWVDHHIHDGKKHLNFNEFLTYKANRQYKKVGEIMESIHDGWMPLSSYTFIHTNARLSDADRLTIYNWFASVKDSIKAQYPADSLVMPKKK